MALVIYDEAASAPVHRFLSFLRLLLDYHPRFGASLYGQCLGLETILVSGWNALHAAAGAEVPVKYMFVGPKGGLTTEKHPDVPDDEIHVVYEENLPRFEGSAAWHQVSRLSELIKQQKPEGISAEWVEERLALVAARAVAPLRGEDASVNDRISQILSRIREAIKEPETSLRLFTNPVVEVIEEFMRFDLTKTQTANILAVLFAHFAIKIPSPFDRTGGAKPVLDQIDHLIGLMSTITRERQSYDLGSFGQLTYLALLWAETAVLMGNQLAKRSSGPTLPHTLARKSLYAEEHSAHELEPSLLHPISWAPADPGEYMRALKVGITAAKGFYDGSGIVSVGPIVPEEVWSRIQAYSKQAKRLAATDSAYEEFLSPALVEHLTLFLLTMKIGQSMMDGESGP